MRLRRLVFAALLLAPASAAAAGAGIPAPPWDAPVVGNPRGRDSIVEFLDYRCPYCRAMQPALRRLVADDGEARIVLKQWPYSGGVSVYAARVALAAAWQGKFAAVHEALLARRGPLDEAAVRETAVAAGADLARLERDLALRGGELDAALRRVEAEAEALQLKGTPSLVIGRRVIPGALTYDDLKAVVAQAREEPAQAGD